MKRCLLLIILISVTILTLFGNNLSIVDNTESGLILHFSNTTLSSKQNKAEAEPPMKDNTECVAENNFGLPIVTTIIQVPSGFKPVVKLINSKIETNYSVSLTRTDEDLADNDNMVMVSAPFIMRNNLLSTLSVQPSIYSAAALSLQILLEADIVIDFIPDNTYRTTLDLKQTQEFKSWLSKSVINYRNTSRSGEAQGSLLIIYNQNASALSYIQPLIDWKHQKGWDVHAVSTSVAGTSTTTIKNYIQNAYNTWDNPPEYILLLGRATSTNSVPTYTDYYNHNTVGDYKYTLLEGNDIIPDAYIGRLTYSSNDQLTSMVNKIIGYENSQGIAASGWFDKTLLLSDPTDSGPSCTTTIDYIRELIMTANPTNQITYVTTAPYASQMINSINSGISNYYYRGHNGYSGLTNPDISDLLNAGKYPFLIFITCFSANFGQQSVLSVGEQFMRVGTTSMPIGAIGFIGASCETHTCLNNIMTGAIAYGFYREGITNQGQALLRAKLGLLACYPQYPDIYIPQNFQSVNLLGDPTVDIWLKQPTTITVSYPQTVGLSNTSMQVTVNDTNGHPVNDAKVCLLKGNDEIFQVGYTNSNGVVIFHWETVTSGSATLTVTKPNIVTFQGTVTFASATNSFTITNPQIFEQLSSGTDYLLPVSLINNQYASLTDVTATLSTSTDFVTINQDSLTFGNMTLNQTSSSLQNVGFSIADYCPQGEELDFSLLIHALNNAEQVTYTIYVSTHEQGPEIIIQGAQMGPDNVLIPGETSQFYLTLENVGTVSAAGISAQLSCTNSNIVIAQSTQSFSSLSTNQSTTNTTPFMVSANQNMYTGTVITLEIGLTYNNGSTQSLTRDITIGNVNQTSMTGPDSYGYICVANSDAHPMAKPYNWIELNPSLGGSGTAISLTDNSTEGSGSFITVNLPFIFKYYGQNYSQITICSNGFIMPGNKGSQEWMNWEIPGPMVPRPIIAPFWDDLIIQYDSRMYYKYISESNQFVIEWYKLKNKHNTAMQETFEVVICNSLATATPTGDNALLFQYQTFNNVDSGNYGVDYVDHGQYASVGIADHTGLVGIGYTYQNNYPITGSQLGNYSTLFFSTMLTQDAITNPQLQSYQISETVPVFSNNQIDAGETISLTPLILNSGSGILGASALTLTCDDPNIIIVTPTSTLNAINPNQSSSADTPFVFQVSSACPNLRPISFELQIDSFGSIFSSTFSIIINAPQISFTSFLLNGADALYLLPLSANPISIQISNLSNLALENATFVLVESNQFTAFPSQFNLNIPAMGFATVNFNLTVSNAAVWGDPATISGVFYLPGIYDSLFTRQICVGQMSDISSQNFDNPASLQSWSFSSGMAVSPAVNISQTGSEVVITPFQYSTNYVMLSPPFSAYDCKIIQLSFKYLDANPNAQSYVYVAYNNSNNWQNLYCFSAIQDSIVTATCYLSDIPADVQSVRFKWQTSIIGYNPGVIAIDDIQIKAIRHPAGYVSGTIHLDNFEQSMTQVRISTSDQPGVFINPNQDGTYSLPLYQGTYSYLKAELKHFLPQYIYNLAVSSNQTLSDIDFSLPYLRKPVDVTYSISNNQLTLNWQLEDYSDKSFNRIEPEYYKLYLVHNLLTIQDTTSLQTYQRVITPGDYQVYLKSAFHSMDNSIVYSDSSEAFMLNYTGSSDNQLTPVTFGLTQNYPNPFNPKTWINYSLSNTGLTSLIIYNIKGENVRTLLAKTQDKGIYSAEFNGLDNDNKPLSSGIYFYRLTSGSKTLIRKMILLK